MEIGRNIFGQPIGAALPGWTQRALPAAEPIAGRYCRIEKLDPARHAADLFAAYSEAPDGRDWTYMFSEPFTDDVQYDEYARNAAASRDPLHHAIIDTGSGKPLGTAALMRADPVHGAIEVGHVAYAPRLQRTRAGTEAMFLLMRYVFDELGYRRYEWKCDSLNAPSRRAALRYGFRFEGIFRQAVVYKGRNRDTAWYSIIDGEWPALRAAFEAWLAPANFDAQGHQRRALEAMRG